jgi:hypothetical protein
MTWNYRLIKWSASTSEGIVTEEGVAIHEVYYDAQGNPTSWTSNPVSFSGDSPEEVIEILGRALEGCKKPVLVGVAGKLQEI